MKDTPTRIPRHGRRIAALAILLSLTVGTSAQTTLDDGQQPTRHASSRIATATALHVAPVAVVATSSAITQHSPQASSTQLPAAFDVEMFEAMAQMIVADQRVPGLAMAIVHDGKVLSARGYGITDVSDAEPVDGHTVFRLASLSKAFASATTGLLVNDGTLRWDSKLTDYMPNFELSRTGAASHITVADLLSHRVGLPHNAFDRSLENYVDYHTLTRQLADVPLKCPPGTCYAYQNVAFSLIGDIVFAATGDFYGQEVRQRLLKPLGMNDASLGLEGIESSARWAKPHVRARGGWMSVMPKPTYYEVAPAAGVNASASDMAQWLIAQTGHRTDVIPAPLLATLHEPLVDTPGQTRSSSWRRARLDSAGYALGWRVYDYSGNRLVYHAGAVQGYRGMIAMLPGRDLGIAVLWNGESSLPSGLMPTMIDRALGIPSEATAWLDLDLGETSTYYAEADADGEESNGTSSASSTAAPR